jgi:hypothetical protein
MAYVNTGSTRRGRTANKMRRKMPLSLHGVGTQVGTLGIRARIENPAGKPRWINGTVYVVGFTAAGLELRFEPDRSQRAVRDAR